MARRAKVSALMFSAMAATLLSVSACGSSSGSPGQPSNGETAKSGLQVSKDAAAALTASGAVHLAGTMTDAASKATETVDLQLQSDGTSGTVSEQGITINLISVGGDEYVKGPAGFYTKEKLASAVAAKLANKWVKLPAGTNAIEFSLASTAKSLQDPQAGETFKTKVESGTLNGQKVAIASLTNGSQLFVAATGKPYALKIVNSATDPNGKGILILSGFGDKKSITAPAGAIDASTVKA